MLSFLYRGTISAALYGAILISVGAGAVFAQGIRLDPGETLPLEGKAVDAVFENDPTSLTWADVQLIWRDLKRNFKALNPVVMFNIWQQLRNNAPSNDIKPFTTDGCSAFIDESRVVGKNWTQCCVIHDFAYWIGGRGESKRAEADEALRQCVLKATDSPTFAAAMHLGVRMGGRPNLPTPYRWGYGWNFFLGYSLLSPEQWTSVQTQLSRLNLDDAVRELNMTPQGIASVKNTVATKIHPAVFNKSY